MTRSGRWVKLGQPDHAWSWCLGAIALSALACAPPEGFGEATEHSAALSGDNLGGTNLGGMNLGGANLGGSNLGGADSGRNIHLLSGSVNGMLYSAEELWLPKTEQCVVLGVGSTAFA